MTCWPISAAAGAVGAVTGHLDELAAERLQDPPGSVDDAVVAGQVARVVIGDPVTEGPDGELSAVQQAGEQLGVVPDAIARPEGRVLVAQGI